MEAAEVKCPKCGAVQQIASSRKNLIRESNMAPAGASGEAIPAVRSPRHKKMIVSCKRCGYKFRPHEGPRSAKPRGSAVEAEKKVDSFMMRMFLFAFAGIVAVFLFLWAIGKFG